LSGGQQQRVALARSIVTEPKVLLLDEPLSAIDAKLRKELQSRIREIHLELGLTTVFVTHDQDEAMVMSDVIELFHAGRIEQAGSPVSVYTKPVSTFAASFIGSYNQIEGGAFYRATNLPVEAGHTIAIRPETIAISLHEPTDTSDKVVLSGVITASVPRGNVLRYTVQCDEIKLHVDTLFRSFNIYDIGTPVWLTIPEHDCLSIRGVEKEAAHV
ncbi:MAG: ABC transporter ATP-binding protein, partial [Peptococcaceae bacterium]|nr:ABC transporter ATP-binding protein [Peptococcaceae bacterium]